MAKAKDVEYDRRYWPELGDASVMTMNINVSHLWQHFPDHVSMLVAEALIATPPTMYYLPHNGCVGVFLWSVGGDTLTTERPLAELIEEDACAYERVLSDAQAEDVRCNLDHLERISETVATKCAELRGLLDDYANGR